MQAKILKITVNDLKDMLNAVYSKAVNSYYDLREITVEETLQNFIKDFDEKTNLEIGIPESLEQKINKTANTITLDHSSPYQISSNTTLVSHGMDQSFYYNSVVLPTSAYYNHLGVVTNNQGNN